MEHGPTETTFGKRRAAQRSGRPKHTLLLKAIIMARSHNHRTPGSDVKAQGEALTPAAGRDMERPRGGPKSVLLAALLLLVLAIGAFAWPG